MLAHFEILLKQVAGLEAAAVGSSAIERAVQERLAACGLENLEAYWKRVNSSETELQELIEAVVVPETWFFRDPESFKSLTRFALEEWLPGRKEGTLRLLSLPCSTGEEAYSMAIALLDAGFPGNRFHIDAIDISARVLAAGQRAAYGRNSFRGRDLGFRDVHFQASGRTHHLSEVVRRQVRFQSGNIVHLEFLPGAGIYDVIFCRNMLIYFDRPTQDRAIGVLRRLLTAKGVVFVGPAEASLMLKHDFVSTKEPLAFAFRKAAVSRPEPKPVTVRAHHPRNTAPKRPLTPVKLPPVPVVKDLGVVTALADQGRLEEAARHGENYLRLHGPSVQAYYLLGLVHDAGGRATDAVGFYRKALYLDPDHHDTILQLALLLEKKGDKAGAKILNDRLRRLAQKGGG
jgi:chemotaxis protein methyltransferase WspC